MTTRDEDGGTADAADNSDTEKMPNSILDANSLSNNQSSGGTKNWFRSIPRRIRKFIKRHQHRSTVSFAESNDSGGDASVATTSNAVYANHTFVGDGDGTDEATLYSMVDYMGNDEEVAMIRACSQMAR